MPKSCKFVIRDNRGKKQLLANEEDNHKVAKVAKEIVANCRFSNINDKGVPLR